MISLINSKNLQKIIVSTGNILSNQIGRKSNEELLDGLRLVMCCEDQACNITEFSDIEGGTGKIMRRPKELEEKLTEHERSAVSIGAKLFLNKCENNAKSIEEAVKALLELLQVEQVDNFVLAYHPEPQSDCNESTPKSAPSTPCGESSGGAEGGGGGSISGSGDNKILRWHSRSDESVEELKSLWKVLEGFAANKKVVQLGVADLDVDTLKQLHAAAEVPPTIAQINLSSCCVVPRALQEFCSLHDIQLLTHSDPECLLPSDESFIVPEFKAAWALRYQVHVRCRGVLTAKGFIVCAKKPEAK